MKVDFTFFENASTENIVHSKSVSELTVNRNMCGIKLLRTTYYQLQKTNTYLETRCVVGCGLAKTKKREVSPRVGIEPTTTRLRVVRSAN